MKCLFVILSSALAVGGATAQSFVAIDGNAQGCPPGDAAVTGGTTAELAFDYDAEAAILHVSVTNTSPVTPGVPSPLLTEILFNAPAGTITHAKLVGQQGAGGTTPNFKLTFDGNALDWPNHNSTECLGSFNFSLQALSQTNGIANVAADLIAAPGWVVGPGRFDIELRGPGVHGLSAAAFAASTSRGAAESDVNTACIWQVSEASASPQGVVGNGWQLRTGLFRRGEPKLGADITLAVEGRQGCYGMILASAFPGPSQFGFITLPIGLDLIEWFDLGAFAEGETEKGLAIAIPRRPELVGLDFYFTNWNNPQDDPSLWSFSPSYTVTVK